MVYRANPADGVAWVTGASSGIGRGAALELARRGWRVFATARRHSELQVSRPRRSGSKVRSRPRPATSPIAPRWPRSSLWSRARRRSRSRS